ncbi:MAG: hypothetical protein E7652_06100 [Ruminococcaceae bacterium]|nr:hypothetical protein [Oscillospiraceae bacterium]
MKKRKLPLTRILSDALEMPENIFPGVSDINIIQNTELSVENCRGILLYESDEIQLRMQRFVLCIKGEELSLKSYFGSHVSIKGNIESVEFKCDKKG